MKYNCDYVNNNFHYLAVNAMYVSYADEYNDSSCKTRKHI